MPAQPPRVIDWLRAQLSPDLEIVRPLGRGGAENAFLARDAYLARAVVVRVLWPELPPGDPQRARFERAARAAAALHHPGVATTFRFGYISCDVPYLVQRYVPGPTLAERVAAEGPLPVEEAMGILCQVADALVALHRQGFIHRDLSPDVAVFDEEMRRPVLTDFPLVGLLPSRAAAEAGVTRTGEILGSPEHVSPEQLRGETATEASDVYALGVMGYHLLTAQGPFPGSPGARGGPTRRDPGHRSLRSLRPEIDARRADLLDRCLSEDPPRRPRASHLIRALPLRLPAPPAALGLSPDGFSRRLAAIWFADLVGFVRLSARNERRALELVTVFQRVAREVVEGAGGSIVKFIGDGTLAEFGSTEAAVRAALELRARFSRRCEEASLEGSLRIGIHVGDVATAPDGDLYGEGVNVAARLTAAADVSKILASVDVWRQLRGRDLFHFDSLGDKALKGVEEPLGVYEVNSDEPMQE